MRLFIAILTLFSVQALATNVVSVKHEVEIVAAMDPNDYGCQVSIGHYNDVVSSVQGYGNVKAFVVAEPNSCGKNQLVNFVGQNYVAKNNVNVVVKKGVVKQVGLSGYNQSQVSCVKVVRQKNGGIVRRVVRRLAFRGALVGARARQVRVVVQDCR